MHSSGKASAWVPVTMSMRKMRNMGKRNYLCITNNCILQCKWSTMWCHLKGAGMPGPNATASSSSSVAYAQVLLSQHTSIQPNYKRMIALRTL